MDVDGTNNDNMDDAAYAEAVSMFPLQVVSTARGRSGGGGGATSPFRINAKDLKAEMKQSKKEAKAAALNQTSSPLKEKKNCAAMEVGSPLTSGPGTQLRTKKKLAKDPLSPNKDFWKTKCQQLIH